MRPLRQTLTAGHDAADSVKSAADLIAALVRQAFDRGLKASLEIRGVVIPVTLKLEVDDD